jgi:hypothetical protein
MIKIGTKVLCRYYNTPERKFYMEAWQGVVRNIADDYIFSGTTHEKAYFVEKEGYTNWIALRRKEILAVLK